jgi:uncharacterized protein (UPF0333 family)
MKDKIDILLALGVACVLLSATALYYAYQANNNAYQANNNAENAYDAADSAYYEASECVKQR